MIFKRVSYGSGMNFDWKLNIMFNEHGVSMFSVSEDFVTNVQQIINVILVVDHLLYYTVVTCLTSK